MHSMIFVPFLVALASAAYIPHAVHHVHAAAARTQHHSQDAFGNYNYGYSEPNGAKEETRHPDGTVTGSFSYPTADGRIIQNNYVADALGFRSDLAPTAAKDFSHKAVAVAPYYHGAAIAAPAVAVRAYDDGLYHHGLTYAAAPLARTHGFGYAIKEPAFAYAHHVPAAYGYYH